MCGASEDFNKQDTVIDEFETPEGPKYEVTVADSDTAPGVTIDGDITPELIEGALSELATLLFGDTSDLSDPESYVFRNTETNEIGFEFTGQYPIPGYTPGDPEPEPTIVFGHTTTAGGEIVTRAKFDPQIIEAQEKLKEVHDVDGIVFTAATLRGLALAAERAADSADAANGINPDDKSGELVAAGPVDPAAVHPKR